MCRCTVGERLEGLCSEHIAHQAAANSVLTLWEEKKLHERLQAGERRRKSSLGINADPQQVQHSIFFIYRKSRDILFASHPIDPVFNWLCSGQRSKVATVPGKGDHPVYSSWRKVELSSPACSSQPQAGDSQDLRLDHNSHKSTVRGQMMLRAASLESCKATKSRLAGYHKAAMLQDQEEVVLQQRMACGIRLGGVCLWR